ncbi:UNVERIFIED_CONTAM: hypothetical protein GTU68_035608 [Idotea baltica]|nr:hypothetical protein [Idotea baltica]
MDSRRLRRALPARYAGRNRPPARRTAHHHHRC